MAAANEKQTNTEFQNFKREFVKYAATNVVFCGDTGTTYHNHTLRAKHRYLINGGVI